MDFTQDQREALNQFNLFNESEALFKCFILKGYAGTGKTTLISNIVSTFSNQRRKLKLLAPTGRAAKVMASYADFPAAIIHKQIYFLSDAVNGIGLVRAKNLYKNTLFIVDEASMVGVDSSSTEGNLLQDLLNYTYSGDGCSLMLVGDPGQLPPVGQLDSPALQVAYLTNQYPGLTIFSHTLKERILK
jgi:exodeoxyribonuclease V